MQRLSPAGVKTIERRKADLIVDENAMSPVGPHPDQLSPARLTCFLRMYGPISRGAFDVFRPQFVIDLLKLRLQIRQLAFRVHLLCSQTLSTLLSAR